MVIMCVPAVELLCYMVMGWLSVLKYLLLGTRGFLWPCLVMQGIKCHRFLRTQHCWCLSILKALGCGSQEPGYVLSRGDEEG
jgi:hypothetical protein